MINLLEAAVVAVMVLFAIAGFRKGFVKKICRDGITCVVDRTGIRAASVYYTVSEGKYAGLYLSRRAVYRNYGKTGVEQPYRFGKRSRNEFRICRRCLCQYGAG